MTFSLSKYLTALHGAIAIHDMTLKGVLQHSNKVWVAEDMGGLLKKGVLSGRIRTIVGLIFIALGFILQLIPYILILLSKNLKVC